MGFYTSRIKKTAEYGNRGLVGIIIALTGDFCTVELRSGVKLYNIAFRAGNSRLRRLQQAVTLTEISGKRVRYIITGEASIRRISSTFAPKGTAYWRESGASPTGFKWSDGHTWA